MNNPREIAVEIAMTLRREGHEALLAGGCVRDEALGREPKDWDIATSAPPEVVAKIFRGSLSVGASFGVMLVRRAGFTIEVATFRTDGRYGDHRRPDSVAFTDARTDAMRRDFTINGLFRDPQSGEIIDYVGGLADLSARCIRAIGTPTDRFDEDHLRMLRAVRFAAMLEFDIDPDTAAAIQAHAGAIDGVSRERVGQELQRMVCGDGALRAMQLLRDLDLESAVLGTVPSQTKLRHLHAAVESGLDWSSRLAALAVDLLIDPDGIRTSWTPALVLSNTVRDNVCAILNTIAALDQWDSMAVAQRRRCAGRSSFLAALCLHGVDSPAAATAIGATADIWATLAEGTLPRRLLDGNALLEAGVPAGSTLGMLLEAVYDGQLDGRVQSREAAMNLLQSLRDSMG